MARMTYAAAMVDAIVSRMDADPTLTLIGSAYLLGPVAEHPALNRVRERYADRVIDEPPISESATGDAPSDRARRVVPSRACRALRPRARRVVRSRARPALRPRARFAAHARCAVGSALRCAAAFGAGQGHGAAHGAVQDRNPPHPLQHRRECRCDAEAAHRTQCSQGRTRSSAARPPRRTGSGGGPG